MTSVPNRFYRVSAKALILDETRTKFLIIQEANGEWELPGGGLDWEEKPQTCIRRELREEMGLEVVSIADTPCYFLTCRSHDDAYWVANVLYEVHVENALQFKSSDECIAVQFVQAEDVQSFPARLGNLAQLAQMFNPARH